MLNSHPQASLGSPSPTTTATVDALPCFKDLFAVLFECFSIISIGYLSARFKLISPEAKDLGSYLTTFALPMIIFLNIAQMEFQTINLSFLLCMLIAKMFLFSIVTLLTLATSYPTNSGYAGALSILATQSNDFALGYPLIKSLYGDTRPAMLNYLSLMAPIQLLILNPLGIVMLEYEKLRKRRSKQRIIPCRLCSNSTNNNDSTPSTKHNNNSSRSISDTRRSLSNVLIQSTIANSTNNCNRVRPNQHQSPTGLVQHQPVSEMRRKNFKSLALIIPATVVNSRCGSETSIDTLDGADLESEANLEQFTTISHQDIQARYSLAAFRSGCSPISEPVFGPSTTTKPKMLDISCAIDDKPQIRQRSSSSSCTCKHKKNEEPFVNLSFLKALATNPLIIASVIAVVVNLTYGSELPKLVSKVSNTIAASFAAPALFVVGLSMYGKFELILRNPHDLLLSSIFAVTKVILLPSIMRTVALIILPSYVSTEEVPYLTDFSYLYGLLPTAPSACIIAKQYGVLTNVVSISMLLTTIISAPLMLGTSVIINQAPTIKTNTILNVISQTLKFSSIITLVLSLVTLHLVWKADKRIRYRNFINTSDIVCRTINRVKTKSTHVFTFLLVLTQLVVGIGGCMWMFVDNGQSDAQKSSTADTLSAYYRKINNWPDDSNDSNSIDETVTRMISSPGTVAPSPLPHSMPIAYNSNGYGFRALCTMHYILSSGGLIMTKFIILSVLITKVAQILKGHEEAARLSSFIMKIYALFGVGTIIWLVFESRHLKCLPTESSLPTWTVSLYLRLVYNLVLLFIAVPLLSIMFRSENKVNWLRLQASRDHYNGEIGFATTLAKRRFPTSTASLSSDTSSAMTTNTNLDSSPIIVSQASVQEYGVGVNQSNQSQPMTESNLEAQLEFDCKNREAIKKQPQISEVPNTCSIAKDNQRVLSISDNGNHQHDHQHSLKRSHSDGADNMELNQTSESIIPPQYANHHHHNYYQSPFEFNKYSILIVFMIIQLVLNLTSVVQILNQEKPSGTFRQIELANVALDFGQGLLTFLVLGVSPFPSGLISLNTICR